MSQRQSTAALSSPLEATIRKWFRLNDDSLRQIKSSIQAELELGLRDEDQASIKMLITYVRELARGDEIGSYLALDLGGTHFRVLLVTLNGDGSEPKVTSVTHDIPPEMLATQKGHELFDYIALRLLEFVKQYKLRRRRISLGFTFSFPCKQYGLTQSILVKWCKGFNVGGVIGTDVVRQLKDALKRQLSGLVEAYIDVVAVINDTTGTLVACANKNKDCRIGLILGTGFNACYLERLDRCEKWPANYTAPKQVIVNCEWGAMGDHRERRELDKFRNEFDQRVDRESINPKNQTYEKMVAGMYVGELLRLALLQLYQNKLLFCGAGSTAAAAAPVPPPAQPQVAGSTLASSASISSGGSGSGPTPGSCCQADKLAASTCKSSASDRSARSQAAQARRQRVSPSDNPSAASSSTPRPKSKSKSRPKQEANAQHKLAVKDVLNGKHLSLLAKDELAGTYEETVKLLKELNIVNYSQSDLFVVVRLSSAIMHRAAHLVASGVSALLERIQRPFAVIGYDGSLVKHHPYFLRKLAEKTALLTPAQYAFEFVQSSDGSGIGAAVVAAALHKERRPLYVVKPGKLYEMHLLRSAQQSQTSFGEGLASHLTPGMERVGSASSRASSASSAATSGGRAVERARPRAEQTDAGAQDGAGLVQQARRQ